MSYDQPSVPDFLEHYDGIPEVVLGGVQRAPACEKIVTLASTASLVSRKVAHEEGGLRDRIVAIR